MSDGFLCPCFKEPHGHIASVYKFQSQWLLRYSITENGAGTAHVGHTLWLDTPSMEQEKPSLPKLLKLKVPQKVGANFMLFGILLLDDDDCTVIDAIKIECNGKCDEIVRRILVEWVRGNGRVLTWKSLTDTLRECNLNSIACYIDSNR